MVGSGVDVDVDVDVAVVGAGGAGLNLVLELDRRAARGGGAAPSMVLVDPVRHEGADRTWCFWDTDAGDLGPAVTRSWQRVDVVDRDGRTIRLDLDPLRYLMVSSAGFYALAERAVQRLGVRRITEPVLAVVDGASAAEVVTPSGRLRARWVFDSRPTAPHRPPRTALLQHFRGWTLRLDGPPADPDRAVLMDFSVRQPPSGLAFGYVLPTAPQRALVEYTVFSAERLPDPAYDAALRAYLTEHPQVRSWTVEAVEDGAIPMTDAVHRCRAGRRVFRLGTAGGATRGSTGYTFAAMRRQARAVAAALVEGREPVPPPAYPRRHRWMDAVLLRAIDRGPTDGPQLFVRLFERNPPERILRFLDGTTGLPQDLAVMASAPAATMTRAAAGDAVTRLRDRLRGNPSGG